MSRSMDPTLRGGIVALLLTGHATPEIANLLACSQKSVAMVQHAELAQRSAAPAYPEERWAAGRWGHYDEDLNADIRMMLAEDRPTSIIAKECRVSEAVVRLIRQNDCPTTIGTRRVEEKPLSQRPFRIGPSGAALRWEGIAACYPDCAQAGRRAVHRFIGELRLVLADRALPGPVDELLASALRAWDQGELTREELGARLDEISDRLGSRAGEPAPSQRHELADWTSRRSARDRKRAPAGEKSRRGVA